MGGVWVDQKKSPAMPGGHRALRPYIGIAPTGLYDTDGHGAARPQAFLVESGPDNPPLRTHFHTVNQFQYIAGGSGSVGRHDVAPGVVHYADRFTPYGPLRNGPEGLSYMTLRATTDTGISYMPEEREELAERLDETGIEAAARRNLTLDLREPVGDGHGFVDLVREDDGLRVATATMAADEAVAVGAAEGQGAFVVVVSGAVRDEDGRHDAGSLAWCGPGEAFAATADEPGTTLAWLQLPAAH